MSRALLVVNPRARRGAEALQQVQGCLQARGLEVLAVTSGERSAVPEILRRERGKVDRVVVAGGDGTLNQVLQSLPGAGLPLAVVPLGTANNLARTLGIPSTLPEACHVATHGSRRAIDLGWINGRYFFTTASVGLSVEITQALTQQVKRRWGVLAYGVAAVRAVARARPFDADIAWAGGSRHSRTIQVVVGNGRYYGSALPVAEHATIEDGRLDLYSLEVSHWRELISLLPALRRGRHGNKRSVVTFRTGELEIRTQPNLDINIDGEIWGKTPATVRVIPRALEVLAPSAAE